MKTKEEILKELYEVYWKYENWESISQEVSRIIDERDRLEKENEQLNNQIIFLNDCYATLNEKRREEAYELEIELNRSLFRKWNT
jgi:FtsZ-binding cell division protein ZapB